MFSGHYETDVSVSSDKVHYSLCLETFDYRFPLHHSAPLSLINLCISEHSFLAVSMNFAVILYFLNVDIPQGSAIKSHFFHFLQFLEQIHFQTIDC